MISNTVVVHSPPTITSSMLLPTKGGIQGIIVTPLGFVHVYISLRLAIFEVFHKKQIHTKTIYGHTYTEHGAILVAVKFIKAVHKS